MKKSAVVLLILILMFSASVNAFDGMRKGFVLGGGLGFGPVAKVSIGSYDENASGIATNFLIGYAWDEYNMIVFLRDAVFYSRMNVSQAQGFSGIGFYHYFRPQGESFYITGGMGFQDWISLESNVESNDVGFGILIGGGYEFARHVQIYSSLSFGKTSYYSMDFDHTQFLITISAVAF